MDYSKVLSQQFQIKEEYAKNIISLLDDGNRVAALRVQSGQRLQRKLLLRSLLRNPVVMTMKMTWMMTKTMKMSVLKSLQRKLLLRSRLRSPVNLRMTKTMNYRSNPV